MSKPTLRWAILSVGSISTTFTNDILRKSTTALANHEVVAVGARDKSKAQHFIDTVVKATGSSKAYGSYAEACRDPNVDIVYIGTPHSFHLQMALDAIEAGKHVMCEKPMTINARQTRQLVDAARKRGVYVMEAVWTRFLPISREICRLLLDDKIIGDIVKVSADFSIDMKPDELPDDSRLKNVKLGAGALLDLGVYSLTWARMLLYPTPGRSATFPKVSAVSTVEYDIDTSTAFVMNVDKAQAVLSCSMHHATGGSGMVVHGKLGSLEINAPIPCPSTYTIRFHDSTKKTITKSFEREGNGYRYEADAAALDISLGRLESEIMPLDESLEVSEILDAARKGSVVYPEDE